MSLGNSLFRARKKAGLSQEAVAGRLGVSRQTISKWELDETLPDICQSKKLASLYHLTLDELIDFDLELKEIEQAIAHVSEEKQRETDWTKVWGKKYPVLTTYQQEVDTGPYVEKLQEMLSSLKAGHGFGDQDAFLVLKDILAQTWNGKQRDSTEK